GNTTAATGKGFAIGSAALTALALLAASAEAREGSGRLTIAPASGEHSYQAYRLFSATVGADGGMRDVSWKGCMGGDFYKLLGNPDSAQEALALVERGVRKDGASYLAKLATWAHEARGVPDPLPLRTGEATALSEGVWLLTSEQVQPILVPMGSKDVTVNEKGVRPSLEKRVRNDTRGERKFARACDASAGDAVRYRLVGTLPSDYDSLERFRYAFVDEPSEALEVDRDSVAVSVEHADGTTEGVSEGFDVTLDDGTLRVEFANLAAACPKASYGDRVVVRYVAHLAAGKAKVGLTEGNGNTAHVEYSSGDGGEMGVTPTDSATVHTYRIALKKADPDGRTGLAGAKFVVARKDGTFLSPSGTWVRDESTAQIVTDEKGEATLLGLGSGEYAIREVEAPAGYARIEGDIPLHIAGNPEERTLDATCEHASARVTSVDAGSGTVTLEVRDPRAAIVGGSGVPRTGDSGVLPWVAGVAAACVALAMAARDWRQTGHPSEASV
ncbi:MAG: sodium/proton-translocating pyrophosphatase, partial [Parafannyhessea sp.]|uniref:sodium/proton-translocating pyrophosphatase n=1 Tax=Parafannyhessea sp. TaxID=2847324 RepID=UPI003F0934B0